MDGNFLKNEYRETTKNTLKLNVWMRKKYIDNLFYSLEHIVILTIYCFHSIQWLLYFDGDFF